MQLPEKNCSELALGFDSSYSMPLAFLDYPWQHLLVTLSITSPYDIIVIAK